MKTMQFPNILFDFLTLYKLTRLIDVYSGQ